MNEPDGGSNPKIGFISQESTAQSLVEPGLCAGYNEILAGYLQFLRLAKNSSEHTVRAYRADMAQFLGYVEMHPGLGPNNLHKLERTHARAFLVGLQQDEYKRASLARRPARASATGEDSSPCVETFTKSTTCGMADLPLRWRCSAERSS